MHIDQDRVAPPSFARRIFSLPTLVSLALAGAFLAFLVARLDVDLHATWRQLGSANPLYLALAVLIHYTTFLFRGLRWRLLLNNVQAEGEPPAGVFLCSQLVLLGWFANSVAWLRLGDAYRAYLYHEERNAPFVRTMGTILSERACWTSRYHRSAFASRLAMPFLVGHRVRVRAWTIAGYRCRTCWSCLCYGRTRSLAVIMGERRRWSAAASSLGCPIPWSWLAAGANYRQFRDGAIQSLKSAPLAGLWGLLAWLAEIARLYLVARGLGLDLSPALVVFTTLANSLLTLAPTPGGVGAVEAGLSGLLKQLSTLTTPSGAGLGFG